MKNAKMTFFKLPDRTLADVMQNLSNKHCKVIGYILGTVNASNKLDLTYQTVADFVECSTDTVGTIVRELMANNFMKRIRGTIYMLNPEVMVKGRDARFYQLMDEYNAI